MNHHQIDRRAALRVMTFGAAALASTRTLVSFGAETNPSARMLTRTIPATGETLPVIGLGTWQTFDVGSGAAERAPLEAVLRTFVELGGTLVDSSPMYGRSEDVTGEIATKFALRDKLFVATKVWTSGKRAGIEQMDASL